MMAAGAVLPVAVFALLLDNQWVVDAIRESDFRYNEGVGPLVAWSHSLAWRITPADGSKWSFVLAVDFATLLFFVLLAALVAAAARIVDVNRGPLGALIVGWWAAIVAGGITGLVFGPLLYWTLDLRSASEAIFSSISQGVASGFSFGWIAGLGALGGFLVSRPRTAGGRQPYGVQLGMPQGVQQPQQPYVPQQPVPQMPPQQMHPQMPQQVPPQQMHRQMPPQQQMQPHPSAVPYVPPQGQGQQQPPWGAAPVPQQPAGAPAPQQPQQFGAPPVPPQQPAQPAAPQAPEPPAADDEEPPAEPGTAAEPTDAPADPPEDAPERDDDDLDLADRTRIDRQRDE